MRQVPCQIHLVAQHPDDQDLIFLDQIDDVVLAMLRNSHGWRVLRPFGRDARIVRDDLDGLAQALLVAIGLVATEGQDAIKLTIDNIGVGRRGEPNLHAVRVLTHAPVPRQKYRPVIGS